MKKGPTTSKGNQIEHRQFGFVSTKRRGGPLTGYQMILDLIVGAETAEGLSITV